MSETWRQYICRACGLIYDEALGDEDSGLAPGTRFEDIPDDWSCPLCGVTKADFEPYEAPSANVGLAQPCVVTAGRQPGVVIVGGGAAGWAVAAALRALDPDTSITLVTACVGDVYNKPELSVALSRGVTADSLRRETGDQAAARLGVRLLAKTHAIAVDAPRSRLRTTRGTVPYSHLVLAHGARPALPRALPPSLCWRVNDLGAWEQLSARMGQGPRRVVIVGAGMVGCELAEDFARAGHGVTLLDVEEQPLAGLLPPQASDRLRQGLMDLGVRFQGAVAVTGVDRRSDGRLDVALDKGPPITADIVMAATGLATDLRLARSAGLTVDRGVAVDPATMETSARNIFALGDCVSIDGRPCRFIAPIVGQAAAIAQTITAPNAGEERPAAGPAPLVIRLKTRSAPIVIHGAPDPRGAWTVIQDNGDGLVMEQWRDGTLRSRLAA
jgi:rubredoxin-NAD+ reductase